ncbi:tigger transposable element-derived protein 6-like protein [Elysia marginata]|uniref:Tigger transposable element-derived protein 6-like protein n=1 Tax=Elysia marginata TaxID=1093978 RepID=A0AAV4JSY7_9GAST|nr:tigger transposable element-derived protein 6-like protein [Elysia marginata]
MAGINGEVFTKWMEHTFISHTKDLEKPVILFVDGHASHISMAIHNVCRNAGIFYYLLPSHASHILQPLDLVHYKALKAAWASSVRKFKQIHGREVRKENFAYIYVFKDAWQASYAKEKVVKSFEASGLSPWDPDRPDYSKCDASKIFIPRPWPAQPTSGSPASPALGPSASPAPGPSASPAPGPSASPAPDPSASPAPDPSASPAPGPSASPAALGSSASPALGSSASPAQGPPTCLAQSPPRSLAQSTPGSLGLSSATAQEPSTTPAPTPWPSTTPTPTPGHQLPHW